MAKNENKERTGKLTKHDLLSILAVLAGAFCYGLANGLGWFDWIYNLNPMLKDWMGFILVVMCLLISRAVSAIYSAIRKKKEKISAARRKSLLLKEKPKCPAILQFWR